MISAGQEAACNREAQGTSDAFDIAGSALESVATGLVVTDLSGHIRYINLLASKMLGRGLAQARGLAWRECLRLVDARTREPIMDPIGACLISGQTTWLGGHILLIDAHGAEIPVEVSVAPFCWLDDDVSGAVLMLRDATRGEKLLRQNFCPGMHGPLARDSALGQGDRG